MSKIELWGEVLLYDSTITGKMYQTECVGKLCIYITNNIKSKISPIQNSGKIVHVRHSTIKGKMFKINLGGGYQR